MDPTLKKGVRANILRRKTTGIRKGHTRPARVRLQSAKFRKPKTKGQPGKPATAPRLKVQMKKVVNTGRIRGVRGAQRPRGTGFKKSTAVGKPKMFRS